MTNTLEQQLIQQLEDAHAMEQNTLRMIDGMIEASDDRALKSDLKKHRTETERHKVRLEERLSDHGKGRSLVKDVVGVATAVARFPFEIIQPHPVDRVARDAYAAEHMEIAAYELLERIAEMAGDEATAAVARANRADEEAMAKRIENSWDRLAEQSLNEAGVAVVPKSRVSATNGATARSTRSRASGRSSSRSRSRGAASSRRGTARSSVKSA